MHVDDHVVGVAQLPERHQRLLRPINYPPGTPGRGAGVFKAGLADVLVINAQGLVYMPELDCPFRAVEHEVEACGLKRGADAIVVDFHAEVTSEKQAMGHFLDGRVSAVVGTHTHVPTADARVLPGGTAYITDVGMTGARGGVIGVKREQAIEALLSQMPVRFDTSDEDPWLMGVLVSCSRRRRADSIEQVMMPRPEVAAADR